MLEFKQLNLKLEEQQNLITVGSVGEGEEAIQIFMLSYVPIQEKIGLVNSVIETMFSVEVEEDGTISNVVGDVDSLKLELITTYFIVQKYLLNLEDSDNDNIVFETFDYITENQKLYSNLFGHKDVQILRQMINSKISDLMTVQEKLNKNNIEETVGELIDLMRNKEELAIKAMELEITEKEQLLALMPETQEELHAQTKAIAQNIEDINDKESVLELLDAGEKARKMQAIRNTK